MSHFGLTYAGRLQRQRPPKANRRRRKPAAETMRTLAVHTRKAARRAADPLGKAGRAVVAASLVLITFIVLGKASALPFDVTTRVWGWLGNVPSRLAQAWPAPGASPRPAAPAAKPAEVWPEPPAAQPVKAVSVAERDTEAAAIRPLAVIADGSLFCVDARGRIWPLAEEAQPADWPVITGVAVREEPGSAGIVLKADVDLATVKKILAATWAGQISEIHFNPYDEAVLYTRDGIKIILRRGEGLDCDLLRLCAVLADIRAKAVAVAVMDLRYDQSIVVRPRRHGDKDRPPRAIEQLNNRAAEKAQLRSPVQLIR